MGEDAIVCLEGGSLEGAALEAARADAKAFCAGLNDSRRKSDSVVPVPDHAGNPDHIRRLNPLAVGEMINHPPAGRSANVVGWPVDLNLYGDFGSEGATGDVYSRSVPNAYAV